MSIDQFYERLLLALIKYSRHVPPNTADLVTDEKAAVFGDWRCRKQSYITKKNPIWDLKMVGDIDYWGVNGGAVLGGRLYIILLYLLLHNNMNSKDNKMPWGAGMFKKQVTQMLLQKNNRRNSAVSSSIGEEVYQQLKFKNQCLLSFSM